MHGCVCAELARHLLRDASFGRSVSRFGACATLAASTCWEAGWRRPSRTGAAAARSPHQTSAPADGCSRLPLCIQTCGVTVVHLLASSCVSRGVPRDEACRSTSQCIQGRIHVELYRPSLHGNGLKGVRSTPVIVASALSWARTGADGTHLARQRSDGSWSRARCEQPSRTVM